MDVNDAITNLIETFVWQSDEVAELARIVEELKLADRDNERLKVETSTEFGDDYACFNVWSKFANKENSYEHRVRVEKVEEGFTVKVNQGVPQHTEDFEELVEWTKDWLWPAV